jgi:hypothetical protein
MGLSLTKWFMLKNRQQRLEGFKPSKIGFAQQIS